MADSCQATPRTRHCLVTSQPGHVSSKAKMRIELSDGEILEIPDRDVRTLYATLLERARQRGAVSAASKLRPALSWPSKGGTRVALDQFETEAVNAIRNDKS